MGAASICRRRRVAAVALCLGVSQLVAGAPPADAFELTVYTGADCAAALGETIAGALATCQPLSSPAALALGLVAIAVECSPDGTEGVVIPFSDAACENITAQPPVLTSTACTAVPPELQGAVGPTVTGLVLACGVPTPPTPPPTPSVAPSPVPVSVQLFAAAACGGGSATAVVAGASEACLAVPATGGSLVVSCAPDNSEALLLLFAAPDCANISGAPALLPASADASTGACASDAESALGAGSARVQCGSGPVAAGSDDASATVSASASTSSAPSRSFGASGTASGSTPPAAGATVTPAGGATTAPSGSPTSGAAAAARAAGSGALAVGLAVALAVVAQQYHLLRASA